MLTTFQRSRLDWLKLVLEDDTPETPKLDWVIPLNDLPETKNNWADALAKTYKDLEENKLLRKTGDMRSTKSGDKERRNSLLISKLKAAYYLDIRLKEFVPSLWIESECDYNISAAYVRSHMRILSVVSLKIFSRYGYTYLREIVLHRADYKKYKISEDDFKNLDLNDFEDLYLLHLQGGLNHLFGADKV
ncbi:hypothetical protein Tco_0055273, partial [Tanacetum coccineum]